MPWLPQLREEGSGLAARLICPSRDRGLRITPSTFSRDLICHCLCNVQRFADIAPRISAPFYPQFYRDMVSISKAPRPRTPVRQLSRLLDIFSRPNNHPRTASRFIQAVRSTNRTGEVSVAIQNEDTAEDAIVVTSLDKIPFCCHADLLLMNRDQLLTAASILNERLPAALQLDTDRSDSYIRNSIEFIVGLRNDPPDAPVKPTTPSRNFIPSSPISPLAKRSRFQNSQLFASPSLLGDVTEEEELEGSHVVTPHRPRKRPSKRQKLVQGPVSPTQSRAQPRSPTLQSLGSTSTLRRITRSQSARAARPLQLRSDRIPRSLSQRENPKGSTIVVPHPSLARFYTPERRAHGPQVEPSSDNISTSPAYSLAESSASDPPSPTPRITRRKCRRDSSVEREVGMMVGLQKMKIPPVGLDD